MRYGHYEKGIRGEGELPFKPTWACCLGLLSGAIVGYLTGFGAGMGMPELGTELVGLIGAVAGGVGSLVEPAPEDERRPR
ncbi:hypothetical protein FA04_28710 (plasmid) [Ensifer adhaerens]|nr:hypothetical protein FA04_28710 [Ensifer adhaerens]KQX51436.1 hypothetical protein ASD49_31980 [Ensifer sp. Root1298]KQX83747.1 hypothetical protein ASD41_32595 [Ensifer sp. Root1312]KRC20274.1 hypothetical protein ASE29_32010 [Ensifer sp. Root74]KRD78187.1 hypothetical protein ASE71_16255 [Ensifer sp. Root954]OWZ89550.1 hypothetical protein B9J07_32550 [Sinorhizobium sp. LM21]